MSCASDARNAERRDRTRKPRQVVWSSEERNEIRDQPRSQWLNTRRMGYQPDNLAREISRKLRVSWERHLASVPDPEEWPCFDELVDSVRHLPNRLNSRPLPMNIEELSGQLGDQPAFYPSSFWDEHEHVDDMDESGNSSSFPKLVHEGDDPTNLFKHALEDAAAGFRGSFQKNDRANSKQLVVRKDVLLKQASENEAIGRASPFDASSNGGENASQYVHEMLLGILEFPTCSAVEEDNAGYVSRESCERNFKQNKCDDRAVRGGDIDNPGELKGARYFLSTTPTGSAALSPYSQMSFTPGKPTNAVNLADADVQAAATTAAQAFVHEEHFPGGHGARPKVNSRTNQIAIVQGRDCGGGLKNAILVDIVSVPWWLVVVFLFFWFRCPIFI